MVRGQISNGGPLGLFVGVGLGLGTQPEKLPWGEWERTFLAKKYTNSIENRSSASFFLQVQISNVFAVCSLAGQFMPCHILLLPPWLGFWRRTQAHFLEIEISHWFVFGFDHMPAYNTPSLSYFVKCYSKNGFKQIFHQTTLQSKSYITSPQIQATDYLFLLDVPWTPSIK